MSIPLTFCSFYRNINKDTRFKKLVLALHENLEAGHFTLSKCSHTPPCKRLSDNQVERVLNKMRKCLKELGLSNKKKSDKLTTQGCVCGKGKMIIRENKKTGIKFLGCSEFPRCRITKHYYEED